ncbi:pyridoxal phosphate-dependent aminotransferase [Lederbergia lenta]|uniref:Histidinol-phosphate aminotransferase n=1 Tax=Lederbergia lenta TaxID=1467 RepID=A0A2X4VUM7_LEDLE|nr:histidinol-phosphate transaminase [Lederbergia lenta]MCM3110950.1 histidinol-phosphate aminotransferase family protein [Lederbergia lenta]MEC2325654.1 histidinol-phosphate transaminase [Lederbergia lenta]SQI54049.1 histidinol-phosphate aminotransferase [Lederbergia lenta]
MRQSIQLLTPYKVKPEFDMVRLDSNEAFMSLLSSADFSKLGETLINRYPAESSDRLVEAYARFAGFPEGNILPGNGSDELISLISQYALDPGDEVIVFEPDFSMYEKNALIMGAEVTKIQLNDDFTLPLEVVKSEINERKPRLLFLSNPNNPTGQLYSEAEIEELIAAMNQIGGILVLDEAYMDFAGESPFTGRVLEYDNLIILRTASKALGMAALRLGFLIANDRLVEGISCIKPPYNVNTISALIGTQLMEKADVLDQFLLLQLEQIAELEEIMSAFAAQIKEAYLYPSSTNFFLMKFTRARELANFLYEKRIKIRFFDDESLQAVRISAGTKEEHDSLRAALNEWSEMYA